MRERDARVHINEGGCRPSRLVVLVLLVPALAIEDGLQELPGAGRGWAR